MQYKEWAETNEPSDDELIKQRSVIFKIQPKISIVIPVWNTDEKILWAQKHAANRRPAQ